MLNHIDSGFWHFLLINGFFCLFVFWWLFYQAIILVGFEQ